MTHTPPTDQQLDEIEARAKSRRDALTGWINCYSPVSEQKTLEDAEAALEEDVPVLVAEVRRLRALAADATEYRIALPDHGGIALLARRQALAHGDRWAVSTMAPGGGRAWTTEGWQDAISALSVDRLFCWPDPATAVTEARNALVATAAAEMGE